MPAPAKYLEKATAITSLKQTEQPFEVDVVLLESVLELLPFERVGLAKVGDLEFDDSFPSPPGTGLSVSDGFSLPGSQL